MFLRFWIRSRFSNLHCLFLILSADPLPVTTPSTVPGNDRPAGRVVPRYRPRATPTPCVPEALSMRRVRTRCRALTPAYRSRRGFPDSDVRA